MNIQQSSAIPFRRDDGAIGTALAGGGIGVLVISLLAIALVLYLRRRFNLYAGAPAANRLVRVVESTRLGPRTLLSVVEFDGSRYLVAQGEHGVSCLAEKPVSAAREAP
jgi:flagellar biogenesis protein FliO